MNTTALLNGALPHVATLVVFILAVRAYVRRRGFPFLLLVLGFGLAALLAGSALVTLCGGPSLTGLLGAHVPGLWIATTYAPPLCFALAFFLLGRNGSAEG